MASSQIEDVTVSPEGCQIEWGSETYRLTETENESGLPCVVKLDGDLPQGLNIYKKQPILLYTRMNRRHVEARTIYHDKNGPYYEVGQTLLVPDDFNESVHWVTDYTEIYGNQLPTKILSKKFLDADLSKEEI